MKTKKLLFIGVLLNIVFCGYSQNITSITTISNGFIIDFTLPNYTIQDTNIYEVFGINQTYSYIGMEQLGSIADVGYPDLPQYTINLHLPINASSFNVSVSNRVTQIENISHKILPFQDIGKEEAANFSIQNDYYNSNGSLFDFDSQLSDVFNVMGANGISFSIFPFQYNPALNRIEVIKSCRFTITHNGSSSIQLKSASVDNTVTNLYLNNVFENYPILKSGSLAKGRYLIITPPAFQNTLTYFANYKRNIGYDVTIVNTSTTGTSANSIMNYIRSQYQNSSTRPEFVLLVGDHNNIPASDGNISGLDIDDPITDLWYASLYENDYYSNVFLGRLPASSPQELQFIINKTIYMETNLHRFNKEAKFIAGFDNTNWKEKQLEKGHNFVIEETFDPKGYTCEKLYQPSYVNVLSALRDNPLFYIYSGHGNFDRWAVGSYDLTSSIFDTPRNTIFPFVFAFACKTGNFANTNCIGKSWIVSSNRGGITYFGSSVNSKYKSDVAIEKKILGEAFKQSGYVGVVTNLGMKKYYDRFWSLLNSTRTNRYMKAYNLLGDPSLNILGTGCIDNFIFSNNEVFNDGDVITYQASNNIQNNANFQVNGGAEVNLIAGNSILLSPGFFVEGGATFYAKIEPCEN